MRFRQFVTFVFPSILWAVSGNVAIGQDAPQLAKEGGGLLPVPTEVPATLGGAQVANPFVADPSGGFSRIVFQTDENSDFRIVIRDYAVPPNPTALTFALPAGALLHVLSGQGDVRLGDNRLEMNTAARTTAPPGVTLSVSNTGQAPVVVRTLTLEQK